MLVAAGADVNTAVGVLGVAGFAVAKRLTPLHIAAMFNNAAEIEELLACGADRSLCARWLLGRVTPLELARKRGADVAAAALEEV